MNREASGFTLIELVVVIGVLAIVTAIAGDIIVSTFRSYNKSDTVNRLEQNGNYALNLMEQRLRNAREVTGVQCSGDYYSSLNIMTHAGRTESFTLVGGSGNGYINYNSSGYGGGIAVTDASGDDAVNVVYDAIGCGTGAVCGALTNPSSWFKIDEDVSSGSTIVTIQLCLEQSTTLPARQDYAASTALKTSVVVRAY